MTATTTSPSITQPSCHHRPGHYYLHQEFTSSRIKSQTVPGSTLVPGNVINRFREYFVDLSLSLPLSLSRPDTAHSSTSSHTNKNLTHEHCRQVVIVSWKSTEFLLTYQSCTDRGNHKKYTDSTVSFRKYTGTINFKYAKTETQQTITQHQGINYSTFKLAAGKHFTGPNNPPETSLKDPPPKPLVNTTHHAHQKRI